MSWDDCNVWAQSQIIGYSQIRDYEEFEEKIDFLKAQGPKL